MNYLNLDERTKTISNLAAYPGGESIYKSKPPTKLTFMSGENIHENTRKLHLAVDTESLGKQCSFQEIYLKILKSTSSYQIKYII